jgi:hypothetical protein
MATSGQEVVLTSAPFVHEIRFAQVSAGALTTFGCPRPLTRECPQCYRQSLSELRVLAISLPKPLRVGDPHAALRCMPIVTTALRIDLFAAHVS